jgi:GAF domain-containing protein
MPFASPEAREHALVGAFVAMVDTLVVGYDVVDLLHRLVEVCTQLLAVDTAGILLSDGRGQLQVMAYSTEEVQLLEQFQLQANEGPCLDCFYSSRMIGIPDLTETVDRWPRFASRAVQEGFRAVHALPMRLRTETIGGLSLFTAQPGPLPPQDLQVVQGLADIATIGILHERALRCSEMLTEQLQIALNSRIVIEQAKGMLAERSGLDFPDVFALLRAHARKHRIRLSDVARRVVDGSMSIDIPSRDRAAN